MIKEEGYENLNAAAKITSLFVPSGQNSTSLVKDQKLEAPSKPEKPVKPKKLCAHTDDTEINNTLSLANESQVSKGSITDKSSPYNSIWSGMKLLPSYINSKVHAVSVASGFSSSTINYFEDVLKSGFLHKMNREGTFQKNIFLLMSDKLVYFKQSVALTLGDDVQALRRVELPSDYHYNHLLLRSSTIMQLDNDEILDVEMRCLVFKILSQKKSFYVRGSAQEDSDQWIAALQSACREAQLSAEGAEISTATAAPVWVPPTEPDCQLCSTPFTLTFRRHHCRNCGKCVCEYCSKDRVRIPRLDADKLFKVCSPCSDVLKASRQYGH
eukprot:gene26620-35293_t